MTLGNCLFQARKKRGFSQEDTAEKLGVSRQTISKWETDETLPDIRQAKRLAELYRLSLDELIQFDPDVEEIQRVIEGTSRETEAKIDWTRAWGKKYPILTQYREEVDIQWYASGLNEMAEALKAAHHYSDLDAFLVLKDILSTVWQRKSQT